MNKAKTALVLGGGAARGIAHIGVLKTLRRYNIPFDIVAGTSIGSLMGAIYALDLPFDAVEEAALKTTWKDLSDFALSKTGFLEGRSLERIIEKLLDGKSFPDVKKEFAVIATDIENGDEVIIRSGNLVRAIRASCSVPGVFIPARVNGRLLVDGGLRNTVPSEVARAMGADFIVAVDVGYCVRKGRITNIFQVLFQSIQIIGSELNRHETMSADVVIRVDLGEDIDQMAFDKAAYIISEGEKAAEAAVPDILGLMKKRGYAC
ncbi:MAG: patatin-like phospholipase family protein [Candidatus Omnitrophica bacterium]|nr:patatin-like phospholipase family protein [Candidatus Omnitrophota bacterium]